MWNTCLRSGSGGLIVVVLGTSFVSVLGNKIGIGKGSIYGTMVFLLGGWLYVTAMGQEYLMWYGKKTVELRGGGAGATTIMEFWTMEGCDVGLIKSVDVVAVRSKIESDEGSGPVLSGGSCEGSSCVNLEVVGPIKGVPPDKLEGTGVSNKLGISDV